MPTYASAVSVSALGRAQRALWDGEEVYVSTYDTRTAPVTWHLTHSSPWPSASAMPRRMRERLRAQGMSM